jgi:hypothetical protein
MHTLTQLRAGELAGVQRLDLSCGLTEFPREIFTLADSLEILNLSGNQLDTLPDDLPRLHRLQVIFCSDNRFTALPEALGRCGGLTMIGFKANAIERVPAAALPPLLRWLVLTDNRIAELPPELGTCSRLQKLMLAGNRLQRLPDTLAACHQLELLRISANRFDDLPAWLLQLPRLAWLAFAGNPFSDLDEARAVAAHPIARIPWSELQLQALLGEGASGVIHRAVRQPPGQPAEEVAVKCFKGAVTSDGLPRSEMAACMAAGRQPQLIGVEGRIDDHPDGTQGLVMPLVPPQFTNLAGPPSLASCTRDVYPAQLRLALPQLLGLAHGIACAARHLHRRGIVHGDLYAHNMLWNGAAEGLLGDFGAASFHGADGSPRALALQRIEVRAFGIWLGELLQRCDAAPAELARLRQDCEQPEVDRRPLFDEIVVRLAALVPSSSDRLGQRHRDDPEPIPAAAQPAA